MRSRKNGGVIGSTNIPNTEVISGLWSMDDVAQSRYIPGPKVQSQRRTITDAWNNSPNPDIYNKDVMMHLPANTGYSNWLLKDQSGNNWDDYYGKTSWTSAYGISYSGPAWTDWCTSFDGSSYINVNDPGGTLKLGTSNFTIQFWIKLRRQDATQHYVMGRGTGSETSSGAVGWVIGINSSYQLFFYDGVSNSQTTSSTTLARDTWYHIAIVRSSTSTNGLQIYVNGSSTATGTSSGNFNDTNTLVIGADRGPNTSTTKEFRGKLSDIKIALNTSSYIGLPTAALDMSGAIYSHSMTKYNNDTVTAKQPQGLAVSPYNWCYRDLDGPFYDKTLAPSARGNGYHSVYCQSDNNQLWVYDTNPSNTTLRFGTGAYTIEAWVYCTNFGTGGNFMIAGKGDTTAYNSGVGWNWYYDDTYMYFYNGSTSLTSNVSLNRNVAGWYHIAVCRSGTGSNQFQMFMDGALIFTGTDSTNYTDTNPLKIFTSKNNQYQFVGFMCGLRISNTARYTAAFTPSVNTSMAVDNNTKFLIGTTGTDEPRPPHNQWINYGYSRQFITHHHSNETRPGPYHPFGRGGNSVFFNVTNGRNKLVAKTVTGTTGDFNFGTGNFSIEFWIKMRYWYDGNTDLRNILDTRDYFNDTGIAISWHNATKTLLVTTNNRAMLSDTNTNFAPFSWNHVCIQRVNNALCLYINGKKSHEKSVSGLSIGTSTEKIAIGNQSAPNINYYQAFEGWMADLRILKGSGAYALGNANPDTIPLPTSSLTDITNTVLLTLQGPIIRDYSSRRNYISWSTEEYASYGVSGDCFVCNQSPYDMAPFDRSKYFVADASGTSGSFYCRSVRYDDSGTDISWISRMSKPWTIEMFVYWYASNPATPQQQNLLRTGQQAGHEGWQIIAGQNGYGSGSYNNINMVLWTAHNSSYQVFASNESSALVNLKPHCFNHVAIQYDPTRTNKMAIFVNGVRTAATGTAFTGGQQIYNTYQLLASGPFTSGVRISDTARYNNDATTYTIPSQKYTYDSNTFFLADIDGPAIDYSQRILPYTYGLFPSTTVKKVGTHSIRFNNKYNSNSVTDRIYIAPFETWNTKTLATNNEDFTIEFWACWNDLTAGGRSFNTSPYYTSNGNTRDSSVTTSIDGNCLMMYAAFLWAGSNTSGNWLFQWCDTSSTVYQTLNTSIAVATKTSGNMDHIVFMRKGGNFIFYINGIEVGTMFANSTLTQSSNGKNNNYYAWRDDTNGIKLGCDWSDRTNSTWCGYIQDIRFTALARYSTVVKSGVSTMVYAGTNINALPTTVLPGY